MERTIDYRAGDFYLDKFWGSHFATKLNLPVSHFHCVGFIKRSYRLLFTRSHIKWFSNLLFLIFIVILKSSFPQVCGEPDSRNCVSYKLSGLWAKTYLIDIKFKIIHLVKAGHWHALALQWRWFLPYLKMSVIIKRWKALLMEMFTFSWASNLILAYVLKIICRAINKMFLSQLKSALIKKQIQEPQ